MRTFERNLLVVILLVSVLLSVSLLTRGHLWWDDFASYVMQAQSLLDGSPHTFIQHNSLTIQKSSYAQGPVAYPWGFPALLAPLLSVFGLKILALKLVNTFFYFCFLITFHALARLRLSRGPSLALTAVLAFNPALLQGHDLILSDIPFLFFSTLSIFLIESTTGKPTKRAAAITGLVIFAASMLRTNGALLLIPLGVAQFARHRLWQEQGDRWLLIALPYLAFGGLYLFQWLLLPGGEGSYLTHFSQFSMEKLLDNIAFYLKLPAALFAGISLGIVFTLLGAGLFLLDVVTNTRRNLAILSYILVTYALFMVWPETQGLRFIYPILPLFLLLAGEGFQVITSRFAARPATRIGWAGLATTGVLILLSLSISARSGWANLTSGRDINGPFDEVSSEMFAFVREQTPPDSIVVFFRPRLMRLLTGRDSYMTRKCEDLSGADYLVIHEKQGANAQISDVSSCTGVDLPVVFNNRRFTVYQVVH